MQCSTWLRLSFAFHKACCTADVICSMKPQNKYKSAFSLTFTLAGKCTAVLYYPLHYQILLTWWTSVPKFCALRLVRSSVEFEEHLSFHLVSQKSKTQHMWDILRHHWLGTHSKLSGPSLIFILTIFLLVRKQILYACFLPVCLRLRNRLC